MSAYIASQQQIIRERTSNLCAVVREAFCRCHTCNRHGETTSAIPTAKSKATATIFRPPSDALEVFEFEVELETSAFREPRRRDVLLFMNEGGASGVLTPELVDAGNAGSRSGRLCSSNYYDGSFHLSYPPTIKRTNSLYFCACDTFVTTSLLPVRFN